MFRRGSSWFAFPVTAVREAMPRPVLVSVPGTPSAFAGLCHVRDEFLPVLNSDIVLPGQGRCDDRIMLILDDTDGPWGVFVDELSSLQALEVSDAPDADASPGGSAVAGWATCGENVVQVLDASRIRLSAEQDLSAVWQVTEQLVQSEETHSTTTV